MDPERWRRVTGLFHAALEQPPPRREAFLADACTDDPSLRAEVEAMLAGDGHSGEPLVPAMTQLRPGTMLGAYRIESLLGSGGMGEVYRAKDTTLGRDVALKLLPASFTRDPDRLARFRREAQVLASLNHPHIGAIYGLDEGEGQPFLALELVEGDTLAEKIAKGPLPIDTVLDIAQQIADALEAAHDRNIIHRDLKPTNIKVRPDGIVKVLDFGLAKALAPASELGLNVTADHAGTPPALLTSEGAILGTAGYMSPEQAKGLTAGRQSDIWAFGCVVYEMVTGTRAFAGETITEVLAAVLMTEPAWQVVPRGTPVPLLSLMRRCLQKDPRRRQRDVGDVSLELGELTPESTAEGAARERPGRFGWTVATLLALGSIALATMLSLAGRQSSAVVPQMTRLEVSTPPSNAPDSLALAPDGRAIAFVATVDGVSRLWVRPLDRAVGHELPGTDGATQPFWSPDSHALAFFAEGKLKRVDVAGGTPQLLAAAPLPRGGAWSRDDVILFAPATPGGLMRVAAGGGAVAPVTLPTVGGAPSHRWPEFLPDGQHFVFVGVLGSVETRGVFLGTLTGRVPIRIIDTESGALFRPPNRLLLMRGGALVALQFDPTTGAILGDPEPVADGVGNHSGRGAFSIARTDLLAYRTGVVDRRQLAWIDRSGTLVTAVGTVDVDGLSSPELSPDGRRAVLQRFVDGNVDLWVMDVTRGVPTRLTFDAAVDAHAIWAPDGRRIVYSTTRDGPVGLVERHVDDAAGVRPIATVGTQPIASDWSPDGRFILYSSQSAGGRSDVWAQSVTGGPPVSVAQTPFDESAGQFSPDGRWIAYQSDASGRVEIYVRRFVPPGEPVQLSSAGGRQPRWQHDGRELFYLGLDGRLYVARVNAGDQLDLGNPQPLFDTRLATGVNIVAERAQYAVARDGRFLMNLSVGGAVTAPITIVENWFAQLKAGVPAK